MGLLQRTAKAIAVENGTADWATFDFPILRIALSTIQENPYQPRLLYDPQSLIELATNIMKTSADIPATSGLQQIPIARVMRMDGADVYYPLPKSYYADIDALGRVIKEEEIAIELCFGHRRFRAFQILAHGIEHIYPDLIDTFENVEGLMLPNADYQTLPLQLVFADNRQMWQHAVTENAQRKDISAIEEALTLQRAMHEFDLTTAQAGNAFGWQRTTAANKLRLLKLPKPIQDSIAQDRISEKHGRLLLHLEPAPALLNHIYTELCEREMSTRELSSSIDQQVAQCPPIPDQPAQMNDQEAEQVCPLPWPLDWSPNAPQIEGACHDCPFRVQFKSKEVHRCVQFANGSQGPCYGQKVALWAEENRSSKAAIVQHEPAARAESQTATQTNISQRLETTHHTTPEAPSAESATVDSQQLTLDLPDPLIFKLLAIIRESQLSDDEKQLIFQQLDRWVS